jgi:hypothetical protein
MGMQLGLVEGPLRKKEVEAVLAPETKDETKINPLAMATTHMLNTC